MSRRFQRKPRGLLSTFLHLPVYLFRLNLGWLLGERFLMLTHQGRRTGLLHQTVLEVLRFDRRTQTAIVLAARGERAGWLRNVQAHPPLEVQIGHRRYVPAYRVLAPGEAEAEWADFARRHSTEARLAPRILGWEASGAATGPTASGGICLVAFYPRRAEPALVRVAPTN